MFPGNKMFTYMEFKAGIQRQSHGSNDVQSEQLENISLVFRQHFVKQLIIRMQEETLNSLITPNTCSQYNANATQIHVLSNIKGT